MQVRKGADSNRKPSDFARILRALVTSAFILAAGGCIGEGKVTDQPAESSAMTGIFVDSPVAGLGYRTPTWNGVTDKEGRFFYQENERVTFFIGSLVLGHALAGEKITPIDLVPEARDERNHSVTNMCRLLQSLDWDGNPENGILLTEEITEEFTDLFLDLSLQPGDFEFQPQIVNLFSILNARQAFSENTDRSLCSADNARSHFRRSLFGNSSILQRGYSPSYAIGIRSFEEDGSAFLGSLALAVYPAGDGSSIEDDRLADGGDSENEGLLLESKYESRLRQMINDYRAQSTKAPLVLDPHLQDLARAHSLSMQALGVMSHDGFNDRFQRSGYSICVENVGWNYQTPEAMFRGWKNSAGHNRNMLEARIGFAGISREGSHITFLACGR